MTRRRTIHSGRGYLRRRALELATSATRALTDPLAEWAVKRIRLDGVPFRFEGHAYLRSIYDDTAPHIVLSKAAQIGGTTWAILRSFHACLQGLNVIYFFPTRTDVLDFSKSRVSRLLAENPFLARQMQDTDTAGLKRIGDAHLYLRGMQSSVGMKSVPADMIVFDELDEATPDARALAWERIGHSDYKRVIELSNPSLPNYGIDEQFEKSDQRHWTLKCPGCGEWTCLEREFPAKLGQEVRVILPREDGTYYRACPRCAHELDLDQGEWVADYSDRPIHGYRVSQLFSSKVDPGEILAEYRTTRFPERFYNLKIGIPWANLDRRVDVGTVLSLVGDAPEENDACCYMGVDTGRDLHVVVLRGSLGADAPIRLVHLEVCQSFDDLDGLMRQFGVDRCVIDGLPETHATRAFAQRQGGSVYLCFFNEAQRGAPRWELDRRTVLVNRTEALDASRALLRDRRLVIPRDLPDVETFAQQVAADAKVLDEDPETGSKRYRYVRTGENHFSMALTYAALCLTDELVVPGVVVMERPELPRLRDLGIGGGYYGPQEYDEVDLAILRRLEAAARKRRGEPDEP